MSLKIKTAARLKALFAGVSLSKKTVDATGDQMSKAGLTDESTDEEIDAKLNERNSLYSFEDQKKFEDYQIGKATKEAADKEAAKLKAIEEGKTPEPDADPNESSTDKLLKALMLKLDKQNEEIAAIKSEKVTTTRRDQYVKAMEGRSPEFIASELKKFDKMAFADDEDFTTTLAEFTQDVANSDLGKDQPNGGAGKISTKEAPKEEVDSVLKSIM